MTNAGRQLATYAALGASIDTLTEVRKFATDLIEFEEAHAPGADTPIRLAIAHDLLAILDGGAA